MDNRIVQQLRSSLGQMEVSDAIIMFHVFDTIPNEVLWVVYHLCLKNILYIG